MAYRLEVVTSGTINSRCRIPVAVKWRPVPGTNGAEGNTGLCYLVTHRLVEREAFFLLHNYNYNGGISPVYESVNSPHRIGPRKWLGAPLSTSGGGLPRPLVLDVLLVVCYR